MPIPLLGWIVIATGTALVGKIIYDVASDSGSGSSSGPSEAELERRKEKERRKAQRQAVRDETRAELKILLHRYGVSPTDEELDALFADIENGGSPAATLGQLFASGACATDQQRAIATLRAHVGQHQQARDRLHALRHRA